MPVFDDPRCFAVILAAGDGTRLASFTRRLYGESLPKQYASIDGSLSLLQATVERVGALVPPARTLVVVASGHEALARRQLAAHPAIEVVVQPSNLGTGPGVLLPLARVRARRADARVAVFPSDHHFADPRPVLAGVRLIWRETETASFALGLVGVAARSPDPGYGWIEPGARLGGAGLARIGRFVEKPSPDLASRLFATGALWNTLICAGRLRDFWSLIAAHLPLHAAAFALYAEHSGTAGAARLLASLYDRMPSANLSHDVLAAATNLVVLPVESAGFSDLGTPERVLDSLAGTPAHERLLHRLAGAPGWPVPGDGRAADVAAPLDLVAPAGDHRVGRWSPALVQPSAPRPRYRAARSGH